MKKTLDQIKKNISQEDQKHPTTILLFDFAEEQSGTILRLKEENQILRDEIARLKDHKPKPKIKPSKLSKDDKNKNSSSNKSNSKKRKKTANLVIHKEKRIAPEDIPTGSTFKGLSPYTVQGIQITPFNTRFLLEQWETPEGNIVAGKLPTEIDGHFDHTLKSYII